MHSPSKCSPFSSEPSLIRPMQQALDTILESNQRVPDFNLDFNQEFSAFSQNKREGDDVVEEWESSRTHNDTMWWVVPSGCGGRPQWLDHFLER